MSVQMSLHNDDGPVAKLFPGMQQVKLYLACVACHTTIGWLLGGEAAYQPPALQPTTTLVLGRNAERPWPWPGQTGTCHCHCQIDDLHRVRTREAFVQCCEKMESFLRGEKHMWASIKASVGSGVDKSKISRKEDSTAR